MRSKANRRSRKAATCRQCGIPFFAWTGRTPSRYCSRRCVTDSQRIPLAQRYWARVDRNGPIPAHRPELGPCWGWTGSTDRDGYGSLTDGVRGKRAHRISFDLHHGPIPSGQMVCHHCDNPPCSRPDHLFLGGPISNARDMVAKRRQAAGARNGRWQRPDRAPTGDRNGSRTHPERLRRGETNPAAKVTEEQVREMRGRYAAGGVTQAHLASDYGITQGIVSAILRRKLWAHV